ncbi:hypothetical protein WG902_10595 [Ramlibacter sp. PS3R-8]|uniref:hypothetical protein n=1 Tax=Ramlibacter sp. PS3R-8 TaxID=3133437 RepID=UPI0030A4EF3C
MHTPQGITPPTPGLEREEPELRREEDIPEDDEGPAGSERSSSREERAPRSPARE